MASEEAGPISAHFSLFATPILHPLEATPGSPSLSEPFGTVCPSISGGTELSVPRLAQAGLAGQSRIGPGGIPECTGRFLFLPYFVSVFCCSLLFSGCVVVEPLLSKNTVTRHASDLFTDKEVGFSIVIKKKIILEDSL